MSVSVACGAVFNAAPGRLDIGIVVAAAVLWPTMSVLAAALRPTPSPDTQAGKPTASAATPDGAAADGSLSTLGVIVRIGNEPVEVARSTVLLNKATGLPVVLSSAVPVDPALQRLGVDVIVEPGAVAAIERCTRRLDTDMVMLVSGRAVVDADAAGAMRQALATGVDWVIGEVEPLSRDEVLCDPGQAVGAALRQTARAAGAALWENDAIALRSAAILSHTARRDAAVGRHAAERPQRSLGHWLRELQRDGSRGTALRTRVAWRSLPADPGSYWPDSVARHRMRLRDALGAATQGPAIARLVCLGIAAFELSIVPALLWIAAPVWVGAGGVFPFDVAPALAATAVGGAALLRWVALRRATGVPLRPRADLTAAAYRLPASFRSVVGPRRTSSDRTTNSPLTLGALVCTVLAGWAIVSLPAAQRPTVTVAVTATMLAMLWYVAVLGLSQSNWARTAFRLPVHLQATIDGVPTAVFNGSPGGLAVRPAPRSSGDRPIPVTIRLDDGSELPCTATIVARRGVGPNTSAGLRLSLTDQGRERWLSQLHSSLSSRDDLATAQPPTSADTHGRTTGIDGGKPGDPLVAGGRSVAERAVSAIVSVVAAATVLVLVAVVGGVQLSVIRSESMVPTYEVGDVVFSRQIPAAELNIGDVAQIPSELAASEQGETLTHRVMAVTDNDDGTVLIETRGDNNSQSEETLLYGEQSVGRVRAAMPAIGRPLLWVRQQWVAVVASALTIALLTWLARRRRRNPGHHRA
ncbi:MAG: signal peptidase I [Actinobacteria bacterium]|nr:signal peptidase I [Actinomycetota bacterium]